MFAHLHLTFHPVFFPLICNILIFISFFFFNHASEFCSIFFIVLNLSLVLSSRYADLCSFYIKLYYNYNYIREKICLLTLWCRLPYFLHTVSGKSIQCFIAVANAQGRNISLIYCLAALREWLDMSQTGTFKLYGG